MPMLIVLVALVDGQREVTALGVTTADRLAALGVTHVTIARDQRTEAVVLDGWAFDAITHAAEASDLVGGGAATQTLQPVLQVLITPEGRPGAHREETSDRAGTRTGVRQGVLDPDGAPPSAVHPH
ncbi:hypothetical protein [Intrasporangium calvum]|uniref:Uncharacterized protein n=1 Tax=Intrasporangium calvum (strain ATCC 23552 / DSM 43043 / JCM 3097 / NBRC 12989 / NCIMB 10167 / NRRL B-3866 / 7 KIP) TaxID=710696 RepID=E6S849_INTC7|nr:hypothetical protein [Intrasporangium calvum]ADU46953.1 hypothetical protein Intca_0404 [Intrasporangium calvum DSM 43043]